MQLVMPPDLSLTQRMAFDPRVGKKRRTERAITEGRDAAPGTAHVPRVNHGMRKHDRGVAAIQKDFPHENARLPAVSEQKALVTVRSAHALEHDAHVHTRTAARDACREGAAIREPRPERTRGDRSRPPRDVAGRDAHGD